MPSEDLAALFLSIRDALVARGTWRVDWGEDAEVRNIAEEVEAAIVDDDLGAVLADFYRHLTSDGRSEYAILLGLDRALARIHPLRRRRRDPIPAALQPLHTQVTLTGRLNEHANDGHLLFRHAEPESPATQFDLDRQFHSVVWVPAAATRDCVVRAFRSRYDITVAGSTLKVGCAPVVGHLEEMSVRVTGRSPRYYSIEIDADRAPWAERIAAILTEADRSGADVLLLPEVTTNPALVQQWQAEVRKPIAPRRTRLKWIVAGTGPADIGDPPFNRAWVIDRRSGARLFEQDKIVPYTMEARTVESWGLVGLFGGPGDAYEAMSRGQSTTIAEASAGRFAILICQDLSEILDVGARVRDADVSVVLVPVFDSELSAERWHHDKAKELRQAAGSRVVVSNSLAIARHADPTAAGRPVTTSLVEHPAGLGGVAYRDLPLLATATSPTSLAVFDVPVHKLLVD